MNKNIRGITTYLSLAFLFIVLFIYLSSLSVFYKNVLNI